MAVSELRDRLGHGLRDYRLYAAERPNQGRRARLAEAGRNLAIGLGATRFRGAPVQFEYRGYTIPLDLAEMTGGADDTWDEIAHAHLGYYRRWTPIESDHTMLEVGCGIGRDAIHLTEVITPPGRYIGVDITRPSIEWCRRNITARHPHFEFHALDVHSDMYNPTGTLSNTDVTFPVASDSVDRIALHSVFTHMFAADVSRYLTEFARVLTADGTVLVSVFVMEPESLAAADAQNGALTFRHAVDDDCRTNDAAHPEAAVGFTLGALERLVADAGLVIDDVHRGFWSGLHADAPNGQDVLILSRK